MEARPETPKVEPPKQEAPKPKLRLPSVSYKKMMVVSLVVLAILVGVLVWRISTVGVDLDIDLKGGTQLSFGMQSAPDVGSIEKILSGYGATVRVARSITGYSVIIDVGSEVDSKAIKDALESGGYDLKDYSVQTVGPALGGSFFVQAQTALLLAFAFMAITIFVLFRVPLPSFYVIFCAAADLTEAFVVSQLFGIKLSLATFAALLLLIGYSVDTDILLTARVLKGTEGDVRTRIRGAMKTGLTMSGTMMAALFALFTLSTSQVITHISSVLIIGMFFDIINTWTINAGLIHLYVDKKAIKK